jgi:hypothetical protein
MGRRERREGGKKGTGANHAGEDPPESISCTMSFLFPSIERVGELKERLANGVGEGYSRRIDKGDVADAPALSSKAERVD